VNEAPLKGDSVRVIDVPSGKLCSQSVGQSIPGPDTEPGPLTSTKTVTCGRGAVKDAVTLTSSVTVPRLQVLEVPEQAPPQPAKL
jgi:hypothetical protein